MTRVESNLRLWQDIFWVHLNIFVCPEKGHQGSKLHVNISLQLYYNTVNNKTNSIINSDCFPMMSRWNEVNKAVRGDSCSIYNWNWLLGRSLVSHIYLLSPFGKKKSKKVGGYSSNSGIMNDTTYWHRQGLSSKNFCLWENLFYLK